MITVCIAIAVVLLSWIYWYQRDSNLPPGPRGVPLFGVIPFLGGHSAKKICEWTKKYGSVLTVRFGEQDFLALTEYDDMHEVLIKQGGKVEGRPPLSIFDKATRGLGIIFASGKVWDSSRPFVANTLRRFGMGKKILEFRIQEESRNMINNIREKDGKAFDPKVLFFLANINVAASIVVGQRFSYDDEEFNELVRRLTRPWQEDGLYLVLMGYCSYLYRLPFFNGAFKRFMGDFAFLRGVLQRFVREHEITFDENEIRDVIDAFIEETRKENCDKTFTEDNLLMITRDILEGGTHTTSCTLLWLVVGLVKHPKYQRKIRAEAEAIIGTDETVTAVHRKRMPLTVAFIHEVMRLCVMLGHPHVCSTGEVELHGYKIPKGTPIIPVIWNIHNNPKYFDNPKEFRPERFINPEDGNFVKSRYANPFSLGRRSCVGKQMARMEMFSFLVNMIQRFDIEAEDEKTIPAFDEGQYGIVYVPPRFKIRFTER